MDIKVLESLTTALPVMTVGDASLDNLYPALIQCFAVILCGYLAGRWEIVTQEQSSGLNTFVGTFSLPSLIFLSLATLNLSSVNWYFLGSILIAKTIVFAFVAVITLLVTRPFSPGRSGLYAIFCTQSNDFAIGFPIVAALYQKTHPEYVSYLYLLAPVSLIILNPFGFILMELDKHKALLHGEHVNRNSTNIAGNIARSIATNPIVFMTFLGVIANLLCNHALPAAVSDILNVFGSAFIGTALFLLGLRMVGKVGKANGMALLVPGILIAVKLIAMPLVIREVVSLILRTSGANAQEIQDMSTYGFLYGTFPSAPGVFVYATRYALDVDLIASSMVACTFLSAPLMFASAKMVIASKLNPEQYLQTLNLFEFYISIVASLASIWLLVTMIVNKSYQSLPYRMTVFLVLSQLFGCLGFLLSHLPSPTLHYVHFAVETIGDISSCLWTSLIATGLLLIECRSLASLSQLQPLFIFLAWGFPTIAVVALMLSVTPTSSEAIEGYEYGQAQAGVLLFIFVISFIVTLMCLVLHQWYLRRRKQYLLLVREANECATSIQVNYEHAPIVESSSEIDTHNSHESLHSHIEHTDEDIEESETLRLIVLLVFLLCCIFIRLSMCIWRVVMEDITGVYVELLFLDTSLNRGQSLIVLAVLGLDVKILIQPLVSWVGQIWYGVEKIRLPEWDELQFETKHVCEQFITHHMEQCKSDIVVDIRTNLWRQKQVFSGDSLVTWLVAHNIAENRNDATTYGSHLLYGKVVRHIYNVKLFHDSCEIFYTFITPN